MPKTSKFRQNLQNPLHHTVPKFVVDIFLLKICLKFILKLHLCHLMIWKTWEWEKDTQREYPNWEMQPIEQWLCLQMNCTLEICRILLMDHLNWRPLKENYKNNKILEIVRWCIFVNVFSKIKLNPCWIPRTPKIFEAGMSTWRGSSI